MNISIDNYLDSLERSVRELPSVLREWSDLDPDLCEAYREQLAWLVDAQPEVLEMAKAVGRYQATRCRITAANKGLLQLARWIAATMHVSISVVVDDTTYSTDGSPDADPYCALAA